MIRVFSHHQCLCGKRFDAGTVHRVLPMVVVCPLFLEQSFGSPQYLVWRLAILSLHGLYHLPAVSQVLQQTVRMDLLCL